MRKRARPISGHARSACSTPVAYKLLCAACGRLFALCADCYHAQLTCSPLCRGRRRRATNRAADLRYRQDPAVRRQRAQQSRDYRARRAEHQFEGDRGSPKLASAKDVTSHAALPDPPVVTTARATTSTPRRCVLCGRVSRGFAPLPIRGRRRPQGPIRREPRPPRAPPSARRDA